MLCPIITPPSCYDREDFGVKGYVDAARWLADLQADGLVKHVGLTNFDTQRLIEVRGWQYDETL